MPKIVYIDMDDTLCHYSLAHKKYKNEFPEIKYPQSQANFFKDLKPIELTIESVKMLINSEEYKPYILTAPSIHNPLSYTEKRIWVEKHFGLEFTKRLIIAMDKSLLRGDFLIDDWDHGRGQESFQGELIHYGSPNYPNWKSIIDRLM
jgi:5'(3')-deoxyribonucleotidase